MRRQRGAYPGLGAALTAFGIPLGEIVATALTADSRDDEDPWARVDTCFADSKRLPAALRSHITISLKAKWKSLATSRRSYLRLLSRMALTADQAAMLWQEIDRLTTRVWASETDLLANPYLICEQWTQPTAKVTTWEDEDGNEEDSTTVIPPPSFWTVDRAVFLPKALAAHHLLPGPEPTWEHDDARRIRALLGHVLRAGEREGHTAMPQTELVERAGALGVEPPVQVDTELIAALRTAWEPSEDDEEAREPELKFHVLADGELLVQTREREQVTRTIRNLTRRVRRLKRLTATADWPTRLKEHLPPDDGSPRERKAREEKAAALVEVAESRFSVLIGPAGTGKTRILRALRRNPEFTKAASCCWRLLAKPACACRHRRSTRRKRSHSFLCGCIATTPRPVLTSSTKLPMERHNLRLSSWTKRPCLPKIS